MSMFWKWTTPGRCTLLQVDVLDEGWLLEDRWHLGCQVVAKSLEKGQVEPLPQASHLCSEILVEYICLYIFTSILPLPSADPLSIGSAIQRYFHIY